MPIPRNTNECNESMNVCDAPPRQSKYQELIASIKELTSIIDHLNYVLEQIEFPDGPHSLNEGLDISDFSLIKLLQEGPSVIRERIKTCHDRIDSLQKQILE